MHCPDKVARNVAEEARNVAIMMQTFGIANVSPFQKLLHMSLLETMEERVRWFRRGIGLRCSPPLLHFFLLKLRARRLVLCL